MRPSVPGKRAAGRIFEQRVPAVAAVTAVRCAAPVAGLALAGALALFTRHVDSPLRADSPRLTRRRAHLVHMGA